MKRYTIGKYPKISLSDARNEAKELSYKISKGIDPILEVKNRISDNDYTIKDLADYFKKRFLPQKKESNLQPPDL